MGENDSMARPVSGWHAGAFAGMGRSSRAPAHAREGAGMPPRYGPRHRVIFPHGPLLVTLVGATQDDSRHGRVRPDGGDDLAVLQEWERLGGGPELQR